MYSPPGESVRAIVPLPLLRCAAAVVLAASVVFGGLAFDRDLTLAFRDAGPSVFPPAVLRQLETVRRHLPPGSTILLFSTTKTDGAWYSRLFQRGLYPGTVAIARYLPLDHATLNQLRARYGFRYAISMGDPPPDPGFLQHDDLGHLPALPDHVWFGELAP